MKKHLITLLLALLMVPMVTHGQTTCDNYVTIPYSTGFEDLFTGDVPDCWTQIATGSSGVSTTFPAGYEYGSNARTGDVYFEFESNSGQTEIVALPLMENLSGLQLSFYAATNTSSLVFEVGVLEIDTDTTFVPVDTVSLTSFSGYNWSGNYHQYTVQFADYTGYGERMAMRATCSGSYTLMLDDLTVEEIPACPPPIHFHLVNLGTDWVTLAWTEAGTATGWELIYSNGDFDPDSTSETPLYVTDTNYQVTGLVAGTTYYAYLRAECTDYTPWVGPIVFTPGVYIMGSTTDTLTTCNIRIADEGGLDGFYLTPSADQRLVLRSGSEDSVLSIIGSVETDGGYHFLRIYDGEGVGGTMLYEATGTENIGPIISNTGAMTLQFITDGYGLNRFEGFV